MSHSLSFSRVLRGRWLSAALAAVCSAWAACPEASEAIEPLRLPPIVAATENSAPQGLTLGSAEAAAVAVSPSLRQVMARVRAARWHCLQVGLPPNPTVGYVGNEIGSQGSAGQQGAFVGQKFVRGGKLDRARAVATRETRRLEQQLAAEKLRVLTDTRTAFYDAFLTQQEFRLTHELATLSAKAVAVAQQLREAEEGLRTDVLQARIERQRAVAAAGGAERRSLAAWRRLATLTGKSADTAQPVVADRNDLLANLAWAPAVAELIATSPQIAERAAAVDKAQCEVAYQESLVVQDVTAQVSVQYDDAGSDLLTGVQVGMPLPLWNRNQGGIGRARAELTAARRRMEATEQALRRRLAVELGRRQAALVEARALEAEVLPLASENLALATEGYEAGELGFLDLLTVQRTYFRVSLESLDAYRELNVAAQRIRGCLLSDSGDPLPAD